jgi:hypothetical protein
MRISNTILGLVVLTMMAGAAQAQKVEKDYDHNRNFSDYKTFMWVKPPHLANPFMNSRLQEDVNNELTAKGWTLASDGADVGIVANGATQQQHTLTTFYDGFGGWRWRGFGTATTTVDTYTVGTLVIDLFDAKTKELIWRGTASETLSDKPDKNADKLNKSVEKLFKDFPPK